MGYVLRCGDVRVSIENVEGLKEKVDFNPFPIGERIVGFALMGERVVPVIDGKTKGGKEIFLVRGRSVILLRYDSIERGEGDMKVEEIEEEVLKRLGGL